jgi:hypothetical protein
MSYHPVLSVRLFQSLAEILLIADRVKIACVEKNIFVDCRRAVTALLVPTFSSVFIPKVIGMTAP